MTVFNLDSLKYVLTDLFTRMVLLARYHTIIVIIKSRGIVISCI